MPGLNLHRLLAGTGATEGFRQNISLTPKREAELRAARDKVRAQLRAGFRELNAAAPAARLVLLEKSFQAMDEAERLALRPKFRMQGSFSYSTVNDPAYKPPQQVDMDDGVYFPMSIVNGIGPTIAAGQLFKTVEGILRPLCTREGWTIEAGKPSSCVRIILDPHAHIDLPLYAIPDEQFRHDTSLMKADRGYVLKEHGVARMQMDEHAAMAFDAQERILDEERYRALPADRIMLAHREGTWETSDPRKLEDWFEVRKRRFGQVLRFLCRYLKAWRDHQWPVPKTGPSSICLMACVVQAFEKAAVPPSDSREDSALLTVAAQLPGILQGSISNPAVDGASCLDADWSQQKRNEFVTKAQELYDSVAQAVAAQSAATAVALLRGQLGERLPNDTSLVMAEEEARIRSVPPRQVASPAVPRSQSG